MQISKQSWHYRLLRLFDSENKIPQTICGYFWKTVLATFIVGLLASLVGFILLQLFTTIPTNLYNHGLNLTQWSSVGKLTLTMMSAFFIVFISYLLSNIIDWPNWLCNLLGYALAIITGASILLGILGLVVNLINHGLEVSNYSYSWLTSSHELLGLWGMGSILLDIVIITVGLLIGIVYLIILSCKAFHKLEFARLLLAFLKAKKDKYCVRLEFS